MRGSSEPEYSFVRHHTLSSFIRRVEDFLLDHGTESGNDHNHTVETFRGEFDRLLTPPSWSGSMVNSFDQEKGGEI
jgi:SMODS and SLOG-associating 2TM effector domain